MRASLKLLRRRMRHVGRYLELDPGKRYEIDHLDYDWSLNGR